MSKYRSLFSPSRGRPVLSLFAALFLIFGTGLYGSSLANASPNFYLPGHSPPHASVPDVSLPSVSPPITSPPKTNEPAPFHPESSPHIPLLDGTSVPPDEYLIPGKNQTHKIHDVRTTDQQLMKLADLVYKNPKDITDQDLIAVLGKTNGKPNGKLIEREDLANGFEAIAVLNKTTGEVIISFRGSDTEDFFADWWGQNLGIWGQYKGNQVDSAREFVKRVKGLKVAENAAIVLTGHSLGGFHAQNMAREFGFPAVTFNAPGLKPHPASRTSLIGKVMNVFNPNLNGVEDLGNAWGAHDEQVVNYVNEADVIGNLGVHYGKVVITNRNGRPPGERNDYWHPFKDFESQITRKVLVTTFTEGFLEAHALESFRGQFRDDGNIAR
ncbi:YqiA/YcfP family alpha/beta fold hydrolase [Effusibacillus lacus]|uniref:YqiA/YcfP family alpha/beta fold hydrolase n=1 Tax=Effusibacillus lacus TaxID=1348429 RepID=UPI000BB987F9|nr:YqiA/YcfP family alpha/beta fold hydrolase [Effusibacillus lacus]